MNGSRRKSYADRFLEFSEPVERWLRRIAAILLAAAVLSQALLKLDGFREAVTAVDREEGVAYPEWRDVSTGAD